MNTEKTILGLGLGNDIYIAQNIIHRYSNVLYNNKTLKISKFKKVCLELLFKAVNVTNTAKMSLCEKRSYSHLHSSLKSDM